MEAPEATDLAGGGETMTRAISLFSPMSKGGISAMGAIGAMTGKSGILENPGGGGIPAGMWKMSLL